MKKILFIISCIVIIAIIHNFISSIYILWSKHGLLTVAKHELEKEKKENTQLKKQVAIVKNPEFIEEQARDKLFMVKPGESSVLIPQSLLPSKPPEKKEKTTRIPNWQQWVALFFH